VRCDGIGFLLDYWSYVQQWEDSRIEKSVNSKEIYPILEPETPE
jgi:hypothetical protein